MKDILIKALGFVTKHKKAFMIGGVVLVVVAISVLSVFRFGAPSNDGEITESNINPSAESIEQATGTTPVSTTAAATTAAATQAATTAPATKKPNTQATTMEPPVPFAPAAVPAEPADYQAQWDAGYLLAIDNPDTSYVTTTVTLTDADRDLLERLCMGEFGSGGFIGAALIAQSVKDAMCFDGYTSVADVIKYYHYDGRTDVGTNEACRQAVRYIFDDNHDAVQHRLLYMYNPYLCTSSFHESQRFILSYQGVRFFDR